MTLILMNTILYQNEWTRIIKASENTLISEIINSGYMVEDLKYKTKYMIHYQAIQAIQYDVEVGNESKTNREVAKTKRARKSQQV